MTNVALMGMSGAGKTTIARALESRANFQPCKSGTICREVSNILFGDETRAHLKALTDALKGISHDILIAAALRKADKSKPILIDSLRYRTDYDFARREGFYIVRISADPDVCIDRLRRRGQAFDPQKDLLHPSEVELQHHVADFDLKNDGSLEELELRVSDLLANLEEQ